MSYRGKVPEPLAPSPPPSDFREEVGARVTISGGWEGVVVPDDRVRCSVITGVKPDQLLGWEYSGYEDGAIDPLKIRLDAKYETPKPGSTRSSYSPSVTMGWEDEKGDHWKAHTSWGLRTDEAGPQVTVSPDRRSVRFTGKAVASPSSVGDADRITWVTFDGAITCAEPLPEIN